MHKNMKGAVAIGAATVLLLGGGGTLAVWNATADVNGGTIYAGQLSLAGSGATGAWYNYDLTDDKDCADYQAHVGTNPALPASYTLVPGDDVIFCVDGLELTAEGGNLFFTVGTSAGTIAVQDEAGDPVALNALPVGVTVDAGVTPTINPAEVSTTVANSTTDIFTSGTQVADGIDVFGVTATDGVRTVPISAYIRVTLDQTLVTDLVAQQYRFALGDTGSVDVTQVVKL